MTVPVPQRFSTAGRLVNDLTQSARMWRDSRARAVIDLFDRSPRNLPPVLCAPLNGFSDLKSGCRPSHKMTERLSSSGVSLSTATSRQRNER